MLPKIQEYIYKFEEGEGVRWIKWIVIVLGILGLAAFYDLRVMRNFSTPEAMDAAQLARNISQGKGFTTDFIRPFSMYLIQSHRMDGSALLKAGHPDLANPPVYPLLLAAFMKVMPFQYEISQNVQFFRHQPDFLIALFNQFWFFVAAGLLFFLARKLFDEAVAWLATGVFVCADLFWQFSVSGLSSMLLVVIFLGVFWMLVKLDEASRAEQPPAATVFLGWAIALGVLVGIGAMTRYSFGWLIFPIVIFSLVFMGPRKTMVTLAILAAFVVVVAPWLYRNYQLCGAPFGTAGYAIYQDSAIYTESVLERSLKPDPNQLNSFSVDDALRKLLINGRQIVQNDLPRLGGSWLSAFFLVGLMVPFKSVQLGRIRLFILLSLLCLGIVQALGRTHLTYLNLEYSSENLLMLMAPMVFVYGAALYHTLLDQLESTFPPFKRIVTGIVFVLASAPMVFSLLPPKINPIVYPPYYPWLIQTTASFIKPGEMMMSDIPWATAWYGRRQSAWLTLTPTKDFFDINDYQKPINALYITQMTMDSRFLSTLVKGPERLWGKFILESMISGKLPPGFPLRHAWSDVLPDQLFLSDWERWKAVGK